MSLEAAELDTIESDTIESDTVEFDTIESDTLEFDSLNREGSELVEEGFDPLTVFETEVLLTNLFLDTLYFDPCIVTVFNLLELLCLEYGLGVVSLYLGAEERKGGAKGWRGGAGGWEGGANPDCLSLTLDGVPSTSLLLPKLSLDLVSLY